MTAKRVLELLEKLSRHSSLGPAGKKYTHTVRAVPYSFPLNR